MFSKIALTALGSSLVLSSIAAAQEAPMASVPRFDFLRANATRTGDMDIDGNSGDLSVTNFDFRAILSRPIALTSSLSMVPMFTYTSTLLDFSDTGVFPIHDEDLHSLALQSFFIQDFANTPWFAVAFARAELGSDFQGIENDDFTFDTALGVFYRLNSCFTIGLGVTAVNINGDLEVFPGPNFDWAPTEQFRAGLYGPNLLVSYDFSENWRVTIEGLPGGGSWNINDDLGNSRTIRFDSYFLGVNTHHRIAGELWFNAGVGYTFGNEIEIGQNDGGNPRFSRDLDGAPLARIGVSLREW